MKKKKQLLYVGNKLSKLGSSTTVIETLGLLLSQEGYKVLYTSSKKNIVFRFLDMIFTTIKYSRSTDYVLIDTYSTLNFWYALAVSQICRFFKIKYITILHGGNLPSRLHKNPFLCNLIFNHAYKIVAPSGYLLNAFSLNYSKNLIFIPNTIEIDKYDFFQREIIEPKILWVRSFSKIYNPKMAIAVLHQLKVDFPSAALCMVGPDNEHLIDECKSYANQLNVSVQFTGKLAKETWIALSKNYNLFINTTHFDNTPVSVIEAMALGLPIVSTNVGGIPFLLKNNEEALLVNDNDSKAMCKSIKELLSSTDLRNNLITNARKKAESFDWQQVKQKWSEILK